MAADDKSIELSVVIVSWNTRALLDRCLKSVIDDARRARVRVEVIVIDNASTDGTADALLARETDIMTVRLERNVGFAAANNVGLRRSSGRKLLLLNPDTEIRPGALAILLRTLDAMPHVGMVSGLLLNPDGSLQSSGYRFPDLVQSFLDFFPLHPRLVESRVNGRVSAGDGITPYEVDHPLGACMLVRREVVDRVGLLDERYFMYSEEIDWCRRIRMAGWSILIAPEARVIHDGGQSTGQMREEMFVELHQSRARYFRHYHAPAFLRSVELMARAAGQWAEIRSNITPLDAERSLRTARALYLASGIYAQARGKHD